MNQSIPRVSVVMPTRNRAQLLRRALDSVFQQTYSNLEVIVLDDMSDDETPEVIAAFARHHPNLRAFRERAGSTTAAIQQVTEKAQGEYIAQLDDDDFWSDPEKTALQVAFLQEHPDHVAVGGGIIRVDGQGRERTRYLLPEADEAIRRAMLWTTPMSPIATLYRRSAWDAAGGFDRTIQYADDWDLFARMGMAGKLYNLKRYVSTYTKEDARWAAPTVRRLEREAFRIRRRYRDSYPGFWKGCAYGALIYLTSYLPFMEFWRPRVSRLWNRIRMRLFS